MFSLPNPVGLDSIRDSAQPPRRVGMRQVTRRTRLLMCSNIARITHLGFGPHRGPIVTKTRRGITDFQFLAKLPLDERARERVKRAKRVENGDRPGCVTTFFGGRSLVRHGTATIELHAGHGTLDPHCAKCTDMR